MEIIGKVVRLGNLTEGTSARGPWRKQDLIIETEEQFPKTVCLTCWSNQIDEIQKFVAFRSRWRRCCPSRCSSTTCTAANDAPNSACCSFST